MRRTTNNTKDINVNIDLKNSIIPMYFNVLKDIMAHGHTHYVFAGGRGSTKSSFVGGIVLPLLLMSNPDINAVCFRKVGNTIQTSIHSQVIWGIYKLGLDGLFHIPKTYSNPIVYKPTGQKIFFMGLDDPNKVKSIKVPFGYIGVTWWEELDQFSGEAELRKVLQSTMRGGPTFWDFRTFNPPISKLNWANEYADIAETRENTLVVRNTYLDVPPDWLGQQFIEEAEDLKAINERAYIHEYMGVATGTGGDVFPNVEDFDSNKLVDINGRRFKLYETFDHIYNGIDWGYARDPFRFVRMHFDAKKLDLYIFAEYSTLRTRNEDVFFTLYDELKLVGREEQVIADSAEWKSIDDFKAYGAFIRGAEKGPESVRYGIKWLQGLAHIYIDKRKCPDTYREFVNYEYEQDKDGNFISSYPDYNNHCLVGDTLVDTPDGQKYIAEMVGTTGKVYAYDTENQKPVITDYINCRQTFKSAEIWEVELEDGRIIECTYDHPFLTSNRGYVKACELTDDDDIVDIFIDPV